MSLPDFFFERFSAEIQQQMESVLSQAARLNRLVLTAEGQACVAAVVEAATSTHRTMEACGLLRDAAFKGVTLNPTPQRLREIMDEVETRWQARARESGVTLLVSYDGDPEALASVDASRLIQIYDGLICQAVAGVRRGAVEASLRAVAEDDHYQLEGRVRGGGDRRAGATLDPREIEANFGLDAALAGALGVQIIGALNGAMRTEANAGVGETVVFEVAVARALEVREEPATLTQERAAHILVVDDNATNRMVAETLCAMFDCTSESAEDGLEAVEAAASGRFDLILMDIKMPRMDGVAATREIRAMPGRAGLVPIVALTANADPDDAAGYIAAGMNDVVEKPMKPENLLRALQDNLGEERSAAA